MRARLAPLLALVFFTAACAIILADPLAPGVAKYAVVALALSNASLLWAYFTLADVTARQRPGAHTGPLPKVTKRPRTLQRHHR